MALRLRIVYDGPAEAGKTTSVKCLSESLGVSVVSPASRGERTLFFDWSEYRGGRFGGAPIHCQLVSVPGQQELFERRRLILETADVVVFVADSAPERLDASRAALEQLLRVCEELGSRAPRIQIQANKRDLPGAVRVTELTAGLAGADELPVVETTATRSTGIRQGFVHAVRLGLSRARELDAQNLLQWDEDDPESGSGPEKLFALVSDSMEWVDGSALVDGDGSFVERERSSALSAHRSLEDARPGSVWPPFEGRMYLKEAGQQEVSWIPWRNGRLGVGSEWLFHSDSEHRFGDEASARDQLIRLAQRHVALRPWVAPQRCFVLLPDQTGSQWRIWQLARRTLTLRDLVDGLVWESPSARVALDALVDVWQRLERTLDELARAPSALDVGLDNLRASPERPPVVGIVQFEDGALSGERVRHELRVATGQLAERHPIERLSMALEGTTARPAEFKSFVARSLQSSPRTDGPG